MGSLSPFWKGRAVRYYAGPDDTYYEGVIRVFTDTYVEVDFADWIERFATTSFAVIHLDEWQQVQVLATAKCGIIVVDYKQYLIRSAG